MSGIWIGFVDGGQVSLVGGSALYKVSCTNINETQHLCMLYVYKMEYCDKRRILFETFCVKYSLQTSKKSISLTWGITIF